MSTEVSRNSRLARQPSGGYIYALQFTGELVKVGKSIDPIRRMNDHFRFLRPLTTRLQDFWFSDHHEHYEFSELLVIQAAVDLMTAESSRSGREWFHHIDYGVLVDQCAGLMPCSYGYDLADCAA
jgi:hypothetical protein